MAKIILSFAMADHGGNFAHWLRDRLMKHYNYFGTDDVYLDCVALRSAGKVVYGHEEPKEGAEGVTTWVSLDTRDKFKSQGYQPIGAQNPEWKAKWNKALSEAHTMIMVITPSYLESTWCIKEWYKFRSEKLRRPNIKGIGIKLLGDSMAPQPRSDPVWYPPQPLNQAGINIITCMKTWRLNEPLLWHPDHHGISEADLGKVFALIGNG